MFFEFILPVKPGAEVGHDKALFYRQFKYYIGRTPVEHRKKYALPLV